MTFDELSHLLIQRTFLFKLFFIKFGGNHSFSSLVETKVQPLPQHNTYPGFILMSTHLENILSNSVQWCFYCPMSAVVVLISLAFYKFKGNKALFNLSLGVTITPFCLLKHFF